VAVISSAVKGPKFV